MILPNTIQGVLDRLDEIIHEQTVQKNALAYFPILYREVTAKIKIGIQEDRFEDGSRMEKLDVIFANRYLEAYHQYQNNVELTKCWQIAFDAANHSDLLILQHLMLGMNAHINLDLGIAAATVAPLDQIHHLKNDFMEINEILFSMVEEIQSRISTVSPMLALLDRLGNTSDEKLARLGLSKTRDQAWRLACTLAALPQEAWPLLIKADDEATSLLAKIIQQPKSRMSRGWIYLIRRFESKDVLRNVEGLRGEEFQ